MTDELRMILLLLGFGFWTVAVAFVAVSFYQFMEAHVRYKAKATDQQKREAVLKQMEHLEYWD